MVTIPKRAPVTAAVVTLLEAVPLRVVEGSTSDTTTLPYVTVQPIPGIPNLPATFPCSPQLSVVSMGTKKPSRESSLGSPCAPFVALP